MGVEDEDLVAAGACPWVRGLIATVLVTGWDGQDRERAGRAAVLSRVLWGVLSGPPVVVPPVERAEAWGVVEDVAGLVELLGSCPGGLGVVDAARLAGARVALAEEARAEAVFEALERRAVRQSLGAAPWGR
jgi:hypothetical protein